MILGYGLIINVFFNCFYLMIGFYGFYVFVGVLLIFGVLWCFCCVGYYNEEKYVGIEMVEIYWYFVDIIWIVLFILIYILILF